MMQEAKGSAPGQDAKDAPGQSPAHGSSAGRQGAPHKTLTVGGGTPPDPLKSVVGAAPSGNALAPVFTRDWHDWIVKRDGQLAAFTRYIRENPERAWLRRRNAQFFGTVRKVSFLGREWFAYGNAALLDLPALFAEQDLHVALAGVPVRADALALRPVRIEDAWHGTHRPLRHADLVGVGLQHPAAEGRMALLRSRHLVDVAGRHSVAFLRTLLKDKLRKLVGHCLVPLKSAHERQRHEGLAAVLALHARDPRQIDDAKTRANLARHASVEDESGCAQVQPHFSGNGCLSMTFSLRFSSTRRTMVFSSWGNAFLFASSSIR